MPVSAAFRSFLGRREPAAVRVLGALCLLALGLAVFLAKATKPWNAKVAARWASEKGPRLDDFITVGMWWGAAAALSVILIVLGLQRWWSLPAAPVQSDHGKPVLAPAARRWVWVMLAAVTILAMWARSPRMDHSLWNDEAMHVRYYVWGDPSGKNPDAPHFEPVTWKEAVFLNKKGNNHIGSSLEARAAHALTGGTWDGRTPFVERNLRLFPWLSGLFTVALTGLLGAALGNPRTGLAAGLILAVHPWHLRWSVELRGYSTMLLGVMAGLWCLLRAMQTNRWRWWLGFAAAQAVVLLWFAGAVYIVAAWNAVALATTVRSRAAWSDRMASALRLVTAGAFSLVPVALIMGPSVPQILAYLKGQHNYAPMDGTWFHDLWTHVLTGLRAKGDPPGTSGGIGWPDLFTGAPWRGPLLQWVLPVAAAGGAVALLRQDWRTRLVALSILGATAVACLHNKLSGAAMLNWYLIYLAPLSALALAWAGHWVARRFPDSSRAQFAPLLVAGLYAAATAPALARQQHIPRQPIREAVALVRGEAPDLTPDPDIVTAAFGTSAGQIRLYDPAVHLVTDVAALRSLAEKCREEGRVLWVYLFNRPGAEAPDPADKDAAPWPAMLEYVEDGADFERVGTVPGMEAMWTCTLYRSSAETVIRITPQPAEK